MSKILLTKYGKTISEAVANKPKMRELVKHIETYFDKNSEIMFAQGPTKHLLFANSDKAAIYRFTGIDPDEVIKVLRTVPGINPSWNLLNDPFIILSIFIIRELELKNMTRERDLVLMFLSMKCYSTRQKKSFPYGANEQIMAYTINHLSDKFKYKTLKNNYAIVKDTVVTSHATYLKQLKSGEDGLLNVYFPQMFSRIAKLINKIASEYYKARDSKNYLNTVMGEDEEGNMLDHENSSGVMNQLSENVTNFLITNSVSMPRVRSIAERNRLPHVSIYQALSEIRKNEKPDALKQIIMAILEVIYEADKALLSRVCSKDFAITAIKQLSVSNSSSKPLAFLKDELNRLLDTHCSKYAATERLATKMAYRNAIYTYIVFAIIANKCG